MANSGYIDITEKGCLNSWKVNDKDIVLFNKIESIGPSWYGEWDGCKHSLYKDFIEHNKDEEYVYGSEDISFKLKYITEGNKLSIIATITNNSTIPFQPKRCGIKLGIDTYMEKYPDWLTRYFPTYLRCEKTHFTGYLMSPEGRLVAITSDQPVASWSLDYNISYGEEPCLWGGHRIRTVNLDLINQGPLPERHPHDLYQIRPKETKEWIINLTRIDELNLLPDILYAQTKAPVFDLPRVQYSLGEMAELKVRSDESISVKIVLPHGDCINKVIDSYDGICSVPVNINEVGEYKIIAENNSGMISEAIIHCLKSYSWYMNMAADAALRHLPRATSHCESYYGLYSLYNQLLIDKEYNKERIDELFNCIYPIIFSNEKPLVVESRIQNTGTMIEILTTKYKVSRDINDLIRASNLADWLIDNYQATDGSYRGGKVHYTSVIYPAKNIMALIDVEKELIENDSVWKERYNRHYESVKKAMDELVSSDGNIDTEGEITFEDGMISCSATQLGMFALMQEDVTEKNKYLQSALKYLKSHECLTQMFIPDSRMRGGTLRFWESQYDIGLSVNMMNSPHGWSSWTTYGLYYAYLLTGDVQYLIQTMNAIGSAMQCIDSHSGKLHWAFVPDPYIEAVQLCESVKPLDTSQYVTGHYHALKYKNKKFVIGEQYLDMVTDWQGANMQDNDVHEHYKCMAEVVLTKAYICELDNGRYLSWNCNVNTVDGTLVINVKDKSVANIHFNLNEETNFIINGKKINVSADMEWKTI